MKRKFWAVALSLVAVLCLAFALTACGGNKTECEKMVIVLQPNGRATPPIIGINEPTATKYQIRRRTCTITMPIRFVIYAVMKER